MYGSEMIPDKDNKVQRSLSKWWLDMVSKAVGVSSVKDNLTDYPQRPTSYVSMRSLAKETVEPPWGVTQVMKKVGLLSRVSLHTESMASTRAHARVAKGSLWGSLVEARKSVRLGEPHYYASRGWKEVVKNARRGMCHKEKKLVTEAMLEGKGDYLGMVAYQTPPGQSLRLERVVPRRSYRKLIRRLRLGMIGDTRVRVSRQHRRAGLSDECPHCAGVRQTSPHVLLECVIGEEMRQAVSDVYKSCVDASPYGGQDLSFHAMLNHVLSNNSPMPKAQDKVLRETVLRELSQQLCLVKQQLQTENKVCGAMGRQDSFLV